MKTLGILKAVVLATLFVGCGPVEGESLEAAGEEPSAVTGALSTYPACCSARPGSGYTESFCDSVAYSPGRCNQVYGGAACTWSNTDCPVTCCQPKSSGSTSWNYCNTFTTAGRCNQVDGGASCGWTC